MLRIKQILQLLGSGVSQRLICSQVHCSKRMVSMVTKAESLGKYYDIVTEDNEGRTILKSFSEREDVIEREINLCGYYVIISAKEHTASDALHLYKGRDASEKLYRGDKSYLGDKSMRVYSDESHAAKIFIEFVALIIRNRIYTMLKDEMKRLDKKRNFMTIPAAIKELEKIELTRQLDCVYRLDHAVTATQKAILNAFGMTDDDIKKAAKKISQVLSENQK